MNTEENDPTINDEFKLRVFSRRWDREIVFTIYRDGGGWSISAPFDPNGKLCDRMCTPHLSRFLRHVGIEYPSNLGRRFSWLWKQAKDKALSHESVQQSIDEIGKWISNTDQNALVEGFWEGVA